jgi:hypothetical protein
MNALDDELRLKVKKWRLSSPEEQDSLVEQLRDKYQRQVSASLGGWIRNYIVKNSSSEEALRKVSIAWQRVY